MKTIDEVAAAHLIAADEAQAHRDAMRAHVVALVRVIQQVGGYLSQEHQIALRAAQAHLADTE